MGILLKNKFTNWEGSMKKVLILALLTLFTLGLAAQCLAADFERIEGGGVWLKTLKITNDGRYVAFATKKSFDPGDPENTWDAYRFDRDTGEYKIISNVGINQFDISDDGRYVVFVTSARLDPIDTDNLSDIYYTDLVEGTTTFASPHYAKADRFNNPNISGDGRYIAYSRSMSSHSNIFVYEIETGTITGAAYGNYRSKSYVFYPVISEDGNIVAYQKGRNIQTINMDTGAVEVIDRSNDGVAGNNTGWPVEISNDGRFVLFFSYANNLIPGVYSLSLYLRDRQEEITKRVLNNVGLHGQITSGCVSDDGKYVSFSHQARLLPEDANNLNDIYIRNMEDDSLELVSLSHDDGPTNSKSRLS
jgi:Tol biopolymer transport system component